MKDQPADPVVETQKQHKYPDAKLEDLKKRPDDYWRERLTPEQFEVARKGGTERAFSGEYWNNHREGTYVCVCCAFPLFKSKAKFESGTGWPSFWEPVGDKALELLTDRKFFMTRTEVRCSRCGAHLGHVFDDGPAPTHKRYCMNSAALKFIPAERHEKK